MATCAEDVKLLGIFHSLNVSPFVVRVMISLMLKDIPYQYMEENLYDNGIHKSQLLLQSNPVYKKVPVFIHSSNTIAESLVILEYIQETWPSTPHPLMPQSPYERALARFWASFVDTTLLDNIRDITTKPAIEIRNKAAQECKANLGFMEDALRTTFAGKPFFGGDDVGIVDLALGSMLGHIRACEKIAHNVLLSPETTPLLDAWANHFCEIAGVKELLPDANVVEKHFRTYFLERSAT